MSELLDHSEKTLIAGVVIPQLPHSEKFQEQRESETRGLVEALGCQCAFVNLLNVRAPVPATLFGSGQLDSIQSNLLAHECDLFIVDGQLTPIQQRNLEKRAGCKVIDRTGLILEIFGLRARTKAGRLQVETARLAYERSRLVRTWTHLERQRGGRGFISGPGETQIEADRRMIDAALLRLRKQLAEVEKTRRLQRAGRDAREIPIVALVGYTNAGKSTLFNRITNADVFAKNMPFATLDPTIRQVTLPNNKTIALVDTVGFITDLPTPLIESFKATLEETMDADVLLHVHDASSIDADDQANDVLGVLEELEDLFNSNCPPIINVWNKSDKLSSDEVEYRRHHSELHGEGEAHIFVSSIVGTGIEELLEAISSSAFSENLNLKIAIAPEAGRLRAWLHENGKVSDQGLLTETNETSLTVSLSEKAYNRFRKLFLDGWRAI